jgi:hypothetical protein
MLRLPQSDKGNWIRKRDSGKTSKFNKRKRTKLWKSKDLKKLKNNRRFNSSKKYRL